MDCLDYHTCKLFRLHTNIKFKAILQINIIKFLIIHVFIAFNGNHHKFFDEFKEDYGFIMDFWNDNIMFVTPKKWKMWTPKRCQSKANFIIFLNHQMTNFLMKCVQISIYIFLQVLNDDIVLNFNFWNFISHLKF